MGNKTKKERKPCNFKFYLFRDNSFENAKVISASSLDIVKYLETVYPNAKFNEDTPHKNLVFFTASTDSNRELTDRIVELYKLEYPESDIKAEDFKYTTIIERHSNADDFKFMFNPYNTEKEKGEKLIPIIYASDIKYAENESLSNINNISDPRRLLMNIFPQDMTLENSQDNELYMMIYCIIHVKYTAAIPHVNSEFTYYDKKFDKLSIYNMLKSNVMVKNRYIEDSSFFIDLLAKIVMYYRVKYVYKQYGVSYSPESTIINRGSLLNYSILSISQILHLNDEIYEVISEPEEVVTNPVIEEKKEPINFQELHDQILQEVIDEYNETYGTKVTLEEVKFMSGENSQIHSIARQRYLKSVANIMHK